MVVLRAALRVVLKVLLLVYGMVDLKGRKIVELLDTTETVPSGDK